CEDDSGKVKVSLWNDEIEKVSVDDKIKIEKGYSSTLEIFFSLISLFAECNISAAYTYSIS
ncbi:hypothetical protein AKJ49_02070, partial [candidate division MSBL1 archaeon SCGC-AAA382A03]